MVWIFFFLISPYHYTHLGGVTGAIALLFAYNFCFWLGMKNFRNSSLVAKNGNTVTYRFTEAHSKLLNILLVAGFVGSVLNIYVKLQLISSLSVTSFAANKEQIMEAGELVGGGISVISSLLYPMCYVAFVMTIFYRVFLSRLRFSLSMIISLLPVVIIVLLGSRTTVFFYALSGMFAFLLSPKHQVEQHPIRFNLKKIVRSYFKIRTLIILTLVLFASILFFSTIQSDRLVEMGGDEVSFFEYWKYAQQWEYNSNHPINMLFKDNDPLHHVGLLNFIHYMVHGFFEYIRLYNHVDDWGGIYYGTYEGYIFFKFLNFVGIPAVADYNTMNKVFYKQAVFTTFWGPFYIDFGIFGLIVIFYFGRFIRFISSRLTKGSFWAILSYPYALTVVLTSPIFHVLNGSFLYNVVSILLSCIVYNHLVKKEKSKRKKWKGFSREHFRTPVTPQNI
jgi:oligosaccharide repeat unit polymerase